MDYYDISAQEHYEHVFGCQSEAMNCFDEARQANASLGIDLREAKAALAQGSVVVIVYTSYFCKSTDAFAGEHASDFAVFETVDDAHAYIADAYGEGGLSDDSLRYEVQRLQEPVLAYSGEEDEIPF